MSDPVSERVQFVTRLNSGERMSDLVKEFGISRKTGYKLLERFKRLGLRGLYDVSRRPHRLARQAPEELRQLFLVARREHPTWGPKKLRALMSETHPGVVFPAASTIGDWLHRGGLCEPRRRHHRVSAYTGPLRSPEAPNEVWSIDYKGQFRMRNGKLCYPLTVTDNFSRYVLACEGFERISGDAARAVLEQLFGDYGLPMRMRSDNGAPFASRGLFGLSRLSAWWLKLGVAAERIEAGHPEQNGRHERMHRTLKAETTRPAGANLLQQQERFDAFQLEFNEVRPHEALGQKPPARVYAPSTRKLPTTELDYPLHDEIVKVSRSGHVHVLHRRGGSVFLSSALADERVGLRELDDGRILISFASLDLGAVSTKTMRFEPADCEPPASTPHQGAALLGPDGPALLADAPLDLPNTTINPMTEAEKLSPMSPV